MEGYESSIPLIFVLLTGTAYGQSNNPRYIGTYIKQNRFTYACEADGYECWYDLKTLQQTNNNDGG
jgi:hypothetical protein